MINVKTILYFRRAGGPNMLATRLPYLHGVNYLIDTETDDDFVGLHFDSDTLYDYDFKITPYALSIR